MTQGNKTIDVVIPVYNDNPYLEETLNSILKQILPSGWSLQVYIVDDGSDIPITLQFIGKNINNVDLLRVSQNIGRGRARNYGASKGNGDYIYLLDVDCILRNKNILRHHIQALSEPLISASCGQIVRTGRSFWARYQTEVFKNREHSFKGGDKAALTTTNLMLTRDAFEAIKGFDGDFTFYGFEDKDLLLRLVAKGYGISFCELANVEHMCDLSLISIYKKIKQAGKFSSEIFINKHPEYYKKMPYVRADARLSKGGLTILALLTRPIIFPLIRVADWGIDKDCIPYILAKKIVAYVTGLAYLHGTYESLN